MLIVVAYRKPGAAPTQDKSNALNQNNHRRLTGAQDA